jgi:hypothetical protein
VDEQGRVPGSIIGDFSFFNTYTIPVSSPAEVFIEYQGILFPNLDSALCVFTRLFSLTRLHEHVSLALHVPNRHRLLYDRAEDLLNFYGGDSYNSLEIELCKQTMVLVNKYFSDEITEYVSDSEAGRPPYPEREFIFSGGRHPATPIQSPVMRARGSVSVSAPQVSLTEREMMDRRTMINVMLFQPQNILENATFLCVESQSSPLSSYQSSVQSSYQSSAQSSYQSSVPSSAQSNVSSEDFNISDVSDVSNVSDVSQQIDTRPHSSRTYREIYGSDAEGVARYFAVNIDSEVGRAVLDHTRTVLAIYRNQSERVCRQFNVGMFDIVSPELETRINTPIRTVNEEYGNGASTVSDYFGVSRDQIVTPELRARIRLVGIPEHGIVADTQTPEDIYYSVNIPPADPHAPDVPTFAPHIQSPGTLFRVYGSRANRIYRRLGLAMNQYVTDEIRARVALLPARDPPIPISILRAYRAYAAAIARVLGVSLHSPAQLENGEPISLFEFGQRHMQRPNNPGRTLIDVHGGLAFLVASHLGVEIDYILTEEDYDEDGCLELSRRRREDPDPIEQNREESRSTRSTHPSGNPDQGASSH